MSDKAKTTLFRQLWLRLLATLGVTAAVLLGWWWRVEAARTPDQIPLAAFGQPIDMGRSMATPLALDLRRAADGSEQLVLTARLENITGSTQSAFFGTPPLPPELVIGTTDLPPPETILMRDGAVLRQLQPRLPEQVELIWTLPPGVTPNQVEIKFSREIFKFRDNLYGQSSWLGTKPAARLLATPKEPA